MTDRNDQTRPGRGGGRTVLQGGARPDQSSSASAEGLTNARTKIVGTRTGILADAIVAVVRASTEVRARLVHVATRVGAIVTPLGWALGISTPIAFVFGYLLNWIELVAFAWACLLLILIAVIYLIGRNPL